MTNKKAEVKSTPEEVLERAIEAARKKGLVVTASSSRLDDDGVSISRTY